MTAPPSGMKRLRVCPDCVGARGGYGCGHGGNCPCRGYWSPCDNCHGDGFIQVECPRCETNKLTDDGLFCSDCLEVLATACPCCEQGAANNPVCQWCQEKEMSS
jgi:hypothetical protein